MEVKNQARIQLKFTLSQFFAILCGCLLWMALKMLLCFV